MKVLAATTSFKSDLVEAITRNIALLYTELSRDADITLYLPVKMGEAAEALPFETRNYTHDTDYGSGRSLMRVIAALNDTLGEMDYSSYDLLHLHVGFVIELCLLRRALRSVPVPVVVTIWQPYVTFRDVACCLKQCSFRLIKGALPHIVLNSALWRPYYRRTESVVDRVLVASTCQAEQAARWCPPEKIRVLANGVAPAGCSATPGARVGHGPARLLYVGHETPAKGVDHLIAALARLDATPFHATLALSDRSDVTRLRRRLRRLGLTDKVVVKGKVDVYREMCAHDLFIVPYRMPIGVSYYPNVLLECFACGLPVITTDWPVTRELMGSLGDDLLVEVGEPKRLAERIEQLLARPERLREIGRQLVSLHAEKYTAGHWVRRHLEEYAALEKTTHARNG